MDESRSGVLVRTMLDAGEWVLPRTPDGHVSEKPVLYYALCALSAELFGMSEGALRGVSAVMALATIGCAWLLARLYGPPRAGWIAALALASNLFVMRGGRSATVDMTLTFFVTAGLTAYFAARRGALTRGPASVICGVCFGLAALSKGPIGGLLPLAIVGGLWAIESRGRIGAVQVSWRHVLASLCVFSGIAALWYVPAFLRGGREFLETSVLSENFYMPIGRPRGIGVGHPNSLHYYPFQQLAAFVAVAPLLPLTLRWLWESRRGAARIDLGTWFAVGFAVFMVAANKRAHYLMPIQASAAALIGLAASDWLEKEPPRLLRWSVASFGVLLGLASAFGVTLSVFPAAMPADASDVARQMLECGRGTLALFSALAGVCAAVAVFSAAGRTIDMLRAVACAAVLFVAGRFVGYEVVLGRLDQTRPFVNEMAMRVPAGTRPAILGSTPGFALDFYWPTPLVHDDALAKRASWLFVKERRLGSVRGPYEIVGVGRFDDSEGGDIAFIHRRDR